MSNTPTTQTTQTTRAPVDNSDLINLVTASANEIEQCSVNWDLNNSLTSYTNKIKNDLRSQPLTGVQKSVSMNAINLMKKQILNKFCSVDQAFVYVNDLLDMPENIKKTTEQINKYLEDAKKASVGQISSEDILNMMNTMDQINKYLEDAKKASVGQISSEEILNMMNTMDQINKYLEDAKKASASQISSEDILNILKKVEQINKYLEDAKNASANNIMSEEILNIKKTTEQLNKYIDDEQKKTWTSSMSNEQILSIVIICLLVLVMIIQMIKK